MSFLIIESTSTVPPYEQVRSQLAQAISKGRLKPEDQLPTVRKLAADLGLAANTVARAYRELELAGIIETRGRNGTFVAGGLSPQKELGARMAADLAQRMRDLGMGDAEMLAIFRNEIERHGGAGRLRLGSDISGI
jgi:DNA-binding transcriptional regulator YhcF (GntR family)